VSGPSNIGNYLAAQGIPALSGFGVGYRNIHAVDESIDLDTVNPTYDTYYELIKSLLASKRTPLASL
jgi:succinyl-diaminopimelate desuccinylase